RAEGRRSPWAKKENILTVGDPPGHRPQRPSYLGDDTVMTRNPPPQKLTDNLLRRLPVPEHGNKVTFDATVKGFGCRVTAAGARAFILNYRRKADGAAEAVHDWLVSRLGCDCSTRGSQATQARHRRRR